MKLSIIVWDELIRVIQRPGGYEFIGILLLLVIAVGILGVFLIEALHGEYHRWRHVSLTELRIQRVKPANVTVLSDVRRRRELSAVMDLGRRH